MVTDSNRNLIFAGFQDSNERGCGDLDNSSTSSNHIVLAESLELSHTELKDPDFAGRSLEVSSNLMFKDLDSVPVNGNLKNQSTPLNTAAFISHAISPIDVILDFKTLDQNSDGEITAVEFIDGLRANRQLAAKFGLADDILDENGTREKYELKFGTIDYNRSETVNVIHSCTS